jgi:hypothetical protein
MSFASNSADFLAYQVTTPLPRKTLGPSHPPSPSISNPFFPLLSFTAVIPRNRLPTLFRFVRNPETPNWELAITQKQYTHILPALTLATNFIAHSLPFLDTIRNGNLIQTIVNDQPRTHYEYLVQPFSAEQRQRISDQVETVVTAIRY